MNLNVNELLNIDGVKQLTNFVNIEKISKFVINTKEVGINSLFICQKGYSYDPHNHIDEIIKSGAKFIVIDEESEFYLMKKYLNYNNVNFYVGKTRVLIAKIAKIYFEKPDEKLKIIGITGTKGKTTTTYMLKRIFEVSKKTIGIIGTIEIFDGRKSIESKNTTPDSYTLFSVMYNMVKNGLEYVVMEVSSQAFLLDRVYGIVFNYAGFTNFFEDHIGPLEHSTYDDYLYQKSKIFKNCKKIFVNKNTNDLERLIKEADCEIKYYSTTDENVEIFSKNIQLINSFGKLSVQFELLGKEPIFLNSPGEFNVENALCSISIALENNIDIDDIKKGLETFICPGRLEVYNIEKFTVIIDYAHNDKSLEEILKLLKLYNHNKLILVFGSVGGRTVNRRFSMSKIACKYADYSIITSDNPAYEDPFNIAKDMEQAFVENKIDYEIIVDRKEAIQKAIDIANDGDIVVLAGKGHEKYQLIGELKYEMSDQDLLIRATKNRRKNA